MDELDLYDDLDDFQEQQDKKSKELLDVEEKYQQSLKTIEELEINNQNLQKKIKRIELSFQSLLDTARTEINRKDKEIDRLRKERDDICFRRKIPQQRAKESESRHSVEEPLPTHQQQQQFIKNPFKMTQKETTVTVHQHLDITEEVLPVIKETQNKEHSQDRLTETNKRYRYRNDDHDDKYHKKPKNDDHDNEKYHENTKFLKSDRDPRNRERYSEKERRDYKDEANKRDHNKNRSARDRSRDKHSLKSSKSPERSNKRHERTRSRSRDKTTDRYNKCLESNRSCDRKNTYKSSESLEVNNEKLARGRSRERKRTDRHHFKDENRIKSHDRRYNDKHSNKSSKSPERKDHKHYKDRDRSQHDDDLLKNKSEKSSITFFDNHQDLGNQESIDHNEEDTSSIKPSDEHLCKGNHYDEISCQKTEEKKVNCNISKNVKHDQEIKSQDEKKDKCDNTRNAKEQINDNKDTNDCKLNNLTLPQQTQEVVHTKISNPPKDVLYDELFGASSSASNTSSRATSTCSSKVDLNADKLSTDLTKVDLVNDTKETGNNLNINESSVEQNSNIVQKLCTPRKLALFDALFGPSPSTSALSDTNSCTSSKSLLSNIKNILANTTNTTNIEVISSATTSPEDYNDKGTSFRNDDDVIHDPNDHIDNCFIKNYDDKEIEKNISSVDLTIDDDGDATNEDEFIQIPGLDLPVPNNGKNDKTKAECFNDKLKVLFENNSKIEAVTEIMGETERKDEISIIKEYINEVTAEKANKEEIHIINENVLPQPSATNNISILPADCEDLKTKETTILETFEMNDCNDKGVSIAKSFENTDISEIEVVADTESQFGKAVFESDLTNLNESTKLYIPEHSATGLNLISIEFKEQLEMATSECYATKGTAVKETKEQENFQLTGKQEPLEDSKAVNLNQESQTILETDVDICNLSENTINSTKSCESGDVEILEDKLIPKQESVKNAEIECRTTNETAVKKTKHEGVSLHTEKQDTLEESEDENPMQDRQKSQETVADNFGISRITYNSTKSSELQSMTETASVSIPDIDLTSIKSLETLKVSESECHITNEIVAKKTENEEVSVLTEKQEILNDSLTEKPNNEYQTLQETVDDNFIVAENTLNSTNSCDSVAMMEVPIVDLMSIQTPDLLMVSEIPAEMSENQEVSLFTKKEGTEDFEAKRQILEIQTIEEAAAEIIAVPENTVDSKKSSDSSAIIDIFEVSIPDLDLKSIETQESLKMLVAEYNTTEDIAVMKVEHQDGLISTEKQDTLEDSKAEIPSQKFQTLKETNADKVIVADSTISTKLSENQIEKEILTANETTTTESFNISEKGLDQQIVESKSIETESLAETFSTVVLAEGDLVKDHMAINDMECLKKSLNIEPLEQVDSIQDVSKPTTTQESSKSENAIISMNTTDSNSPQKESVQGPNIVNEDVTILLNNEKHFNKSFNIQQQMLEFHSIKINEVENNTTSEKVSLSDLTEEENSNKSLKIEEQVKITEKESRKEIDVGNENIGTLSNIDESLNKSFNIEQQMFEMHGAEETDIITTKVLENTSNIHLTEKESDKEIDIANENVVEILSYIENSSKLETTFNLISPSSHKSCKDNDNEEETIQNQFRDKNAVESLTENNSLKNSDKVVSTISKDLEKSNISFNIEQQMFEIHAAETNDDKTTTAIENPFEFYLKKEEMTGKAVNSDNSIKSLTNNSENFNFLPSLTQESSKNIINKEKLDVFTEDVASTLNDLEKRMKKETDIIIQDVKIISMNFSNLDNSATKKQVDHSEILVLKSACSQQSNFDVGNTDIIIEIDTNDKTSNNDSANLKYMTESGLIEKESIKETNFIIQDVKIISNDLENLENSDKSCFEFKDSKITTESTKDNENESKIIEIPTKDDSAPKKIMTSEKTDYYDLIDKEFTIEDHSKCETIETEIKNVSTNSLELTQEDSTTVNDVTDSVRIDESVDQKSMTIEKPSTSNNTTSSMLKQNLNEVQIPELSFITKETSKDSKTTDETLDQNSLTSKADILNKNSISLISTADSKTLNDTNDSVRIDEFVNDKMINENSEDNTATKKTISVISTEKETQKPSTDLTSILANELSKYFESVKETETNPALLNAISNIEFDSLESPNKNQITSKDSNCERIDEPVDQNSMIRKISSANDKAITLMPKANLNIESKQFKSSNDYQLPDFDFLSLILKKVSKNTKSFKETPKSMRTEVHVNKNSILSDIPTVTNNTNSFLSNGNLNIESNRLEVRTEEQMQATSGNRETKEADFEEMDDESVQFASKNDLYLENISNLRLLATSNNTQNKLEIFTKKSSEQNETSFLKETEIRTKYSETDQELIVTNKSSEQNETPLKETEKLMLDSETDQEKTFNDSKHNDNQPKLQDSSFKFHQNSPKSCQNVLQKHFLMEAETEEETLNKFECATNETSKQNYRLSSKEIENSKKQVVTDQNIIFKDSKLNETQAELHVNTLKFQSTEEQFPKQCSITDNEPMESNSNISSKVKENLQKEQNVEKMSNQNIFETSADEIRNFKDGAETIKTRGIPNENSTNREHPKEPLVSNAEKSYQEDSIQNKHHDNTSKFDQNSLNLYTKVLQSNQEQLPNQCSTTENEPLESNLNISSEVGENLQKEHDLEKISKRNIFETPADEIGNFKIETETVSENSENPKEPPVSNKIQGHHLEHYLDTRLEGSEINKHKVISIAENVADPTENPQDLPYCLNKGVNNINENRSLDSFHSSNTNVENVGLCLTKINNHEEKFKIIQKSPKKSMKLNHNELFLAKNPIENPQNQNKVESNQNVNLRFCKEIGKSSVNQETSENEHDLRNPNSKEDSNEPNEKNEATKQLLAKKILATDRAQAKCADILVPKANINDVDKETTTISIPALKESDPYNKPSQLPSISTNSPTPSNFSGLFSKKSLENALKDDNFIKSKKKSPYFTSTKLREYILPAASVLCNIDNLENANKKLHWELLDNKNEMTEIEDDTDVDNTDEERNKIYTQGYAKDLIPWEEPQPRLTPYKCTESLNSDSDTLSEKETRYGSLSTLNIDSNKQKLLEQRRKTIDTVPITCAVAYYKHLEELELKEERKAKQLKKKERRAKKLKKKEERARKQLNFVNTKVKKPINCEHKMKTLKAKLKASKSKRLCNVESFMDIGFVKETVVKQTKFSIVLPKKQRGRPKKIENIVKSTVSSLKTRKKSKTEVISEVVKVAKKRGRPTKIRDEVKKETDLNEINNSENVTEQQKVKEKPADINTGRQYHEDEQIENEEPRYTENVQQFCSDIPDNSSIYKINKQSIISNDSKIYQEFLSNCLIPEKGSKMRKPEQKPNIEKQKEERQQLENQDEDSKISKHKQKTNKQKEEEKQQFKKQEQLPKKKEQQQREDNVKLFENENEKQQLRNQEQIKNKEQQKLLEKKDQQTKDHMQRKDNGQSFENKRQKENQSLDSQNQLIKKKDGHRREEQEKQQISIEEQHIHKQEQQQREYNVNNLKIAREKETQQLENADQLRKKKEQLQRKEQENQQLDNESHLTLQQPAVQNSAINHISKGNKQSLDDRSLYQEFLSNYLKFDKEKTNNLIDVREESSSSEIECSQDTPSRNIKPNSNCQTLSNLENHEENIVLRDTVKQKKSPEIQIEDPDIEKSYNASIVYHREHSNDGNNSSVAENSEPECNKYLRYDEHPSTSRDSKILEKSIQQNETDYREEELPVTSQESEVLETQGSELTVKKVSVNELTITNNQVQCLKEEISKELPTVSSTTKSKTLKSSLKFKKTILKKVNSPIAISNNKKKIISLEEIGIKVTPFKGHLSTFRIPKINKDLEVTKDKSWKLETYTEVSKENKKQNEGMNVGNSKDCDKAKQEKLKEKIEEKSLLRLKEKWGERTKESIKNKQQHEKKLNEIKEEKKLLQHKEKKVQSKTENDKKSKKEPAHQSKQGIENEPQTCKNSNKELYQIGNTITDNPQHSKDKNQVNISQDNHKSINIPTTSKDSNLDILTATNKLEIITNQEKIVNKTKEETTTSFSSIKSRRKSLSHKRKLFSPDLYDQEEILDCEFPDISQSNEKKNYDNDEIDKNLEVNGKLKEIVLEWSGTTTDSNKRKDKNPEISIKDNQKTISSRSNSISSQTTILESSNKKLSDENLLGICKNYSKNKIQDKLIENVKENTNKYTNSNYSNDDIPKNTITEKILDINKNPPLKSSQKSTNLQRRVLDSSSEDESAKQELTTTKISQVISQEMPRPTSALLTIKERKKSTNLDRRIIDSSCAEENITDKTSLKYGWNEHNSSLLKTVYSNDINLDVSQTISAKESVKDKNYKFKPIQSSRMRNKPAIVEQKTLNMLDKKEQDLSQVNESSNLLNQINNEKDNTNLIEKPITSLRMSRKSMYQEKVSLNSAEEKLLGSVHKNQVEVLNPQPVKSVKLRRKSMYQERFNADTTQEEWEKDVISFNGTDKTPPVKPLKIRRKSVSVTLRGQQEEKEIPNIPIIESQNITDKNQQEVDNNKGKKATNPIPTTSLRMRRKSIYQEDLKQEEKNEEDSTELGSQNNTDKKHINIEDTKQNNPIPVKSLRMRRKSVYQEREHNPQNSQDKNQQQEKIKKGNQILEPQCSVDKSQMDVIDSSTENELTNQIPVKSFRMRRKSLYQEKEQESVRQKESEDNQLKVVNPNEADAINSPVIKSLKIRRKSMYKEKVSLNDQEKENSQADNQVLEQQNSTDETQLEVVDSNNKTEHTNPIPIKSLRMRRKSVYQEREKEVLEQQDNERGATDPPPFKIRKKYLYEDKSTSTKQLGEKEKVDKVIERENSTHKEVEDTKTPPVTSYRMRRRSMYQERGQQDEFQKVDKTRTLADVSHKPKGIEKEKLLEFDQSENLSRGTNIETKLSVDLNLNKDGENNNENDSDTSVVFTHKKSVKIRRKSVNQLRILDSSDEDQEPINHIKTVIQTEEKTPLTAKKPRKRRVVKVLSISQEESTAINNLQINDNTTQISNTSPSLISPTLNHPIFHTEVIEHYKDTAPMLPPTPNSQFDDKFQEIDSKLNELFQSPQYIIDDKPTQSSDISSLSLIPATLNNSQSNITIEETIVFNQENYQSSMNTSQFSDLTAPLNDSSSLAQNLNDVKHLSLGSSEYRFEKVSDNVVNLFISRKRKRKHNN